MFKFKFIRDDNSVFTRPWWFETVKDLVSYVSSSAFFNDFDRHLLGRNYVFEIQQLTITPVGAGCECLCSGETVADALRSIGFDWKKVAIESW